MNKSFYKFYEQVLREAHPPMPPNGPSPMPPNGQPPMPPEGMPPEGMPPEGIPPEGMPPEGMPPEGGGNSEATPGAMPNEMPTTASQGQEERGAGVAPPVPNPKPGDAQAAQEIAGILPRISDKKTQELVRKALSSVLPADSGQATPQPAPQQPNAAPQPGGMGPGGMGQQPL